MLRTTGSVLICPDLFGKNPLSHLDNSAFFAYTKFKYRILYRQRTECSGKQSFSETGRLVKALKDVPEMLSGSPAVKAAACRSRYRTVKAALFFKNGAIWAVCQNINTALQAIGYGLLILFFAISIFRSTANFQDFRRPEQALRHFIRFVAAKTAVTYGMDIMTTLFTICGGIVSTVAGNLGNLTGASVTLPEGIKTAIDEVGFLASIPLWLVTILGSVFITALSFVMIMTVYSRFFRLYMYTALAPIPLSTFAGDVTSNTGRTFIKSYLGVCMEGAVIVLACMIFAAFTGDGAPGIADPDASAVTNSLYSCSALIKKLLKNA